MSFFSQIKDSYVLASSSDFAIQHITSEADKHQFGVFFKGNLVGELEVSETPTTLYIEGIKLDKEHRHKGWMSALYKYAEQYLKKPIKDGRYKNKQATMFWDEQELKFHD